MRKVYRLCIERIFSTSLTIQAPILLEISHRKMVYKNIKVNQYINNINKELKIKEQNNERIKIQKSKY